MPSIDKAWVYILASRGAGTLYIGVTTDLRTRIWQHRTGAFAGFTKIRRVRRLVYFEEHQRILCAIDRERELKGWLRAKKITLIEARSPAWNDLAAGWFAAGVDPSPAEAGSG